MATKRAREGESRAEQARSAERRPRVKNRMFGALAIPEEIRKRFKSRGLGLQWMAESVYGEVGDVSTKLQNRMMNGWQPVAVEEAEEVAPIPLPGKQADTIIRRGGQILMKKPLKEIAEDQEELRRINMRELRSVKWVDAPPDQVKNRTEDVNQTTHLQTHEGEGAKFQDDE